jgi:signal transduction histidine kinase
MLLLLVIGLLFALLISGYFELSNRSGLFKESAKIWEAELATAITKHDTYLLERASRMLFALRPISINFYSASDLIFTFPNFEAPKKCMRQTLAPIQRYNISVGSVSACWSYIDLAIATLVSPIFLLISFLLAIFGFFNATLPLYQYKKAVLRLLSVFQRIEPDNDFSLTKNIPGELQDSVSAELLRLFEQAASRHAEIEQLKSKIRTKDAVALIAAQVSHDIRSPLSALNMVVTSLKELPEDKRLIIRNASQRINDIANGLLQQSRQSALNAAESTSSTSQQSASNNLGKQNPASRLTGTMNGTVVSTMTGGSTGGSPAATTNGGNTNSHQDSEPILLVALLDSIISEKRIQFRERMEIEIQGDLNQGYGLFVKISPSELARVISNLVNNSVEAFTGPGRVTVAVRGDNGTVSVVISDNGRGIPAEILEKLGERGVSHGKEGTQSGSGLGLYYAREVIAIANGSFSIQSQVGIGTVITMTLPRADIPHWFIDTIDLPAHSYLVSADDDQTIHQIWAGRLVSAGGKASHITHLQFSSMEQLEAWIKSDSLQLQKQSQHSPHMSFLIDYEFLGQAGNGLDVIERTGIAKHATLVTSRYEEPHVRARAKSLGVKILPKGLAPFIPLHIAKPRERYDAIVIDDDTLVHMTWKMAAKEIGKRLICYSTPHDFLSHADSFDLSTPVFIDVNLSNGIRGEDVAIQIAALGFSNINLATGYESDSVIAPSCVRCVVGKDPIF